MKPPLPTVVATKVQKKAMRNTLEVEAGARGEASWTADCNSSRVSSSKPAARLCAYCVNLLKRDMAAGIVCTTGRVMFSSLFHNPTPPHSTRPTEKTLLSRQASHLKV